MASVTLNLEGLILGIVVSRCLLLTFKLRKTKWHSSSISCYRLKQYGKSHNVNAERTYCFQDFIYSLFIFAVTSSFL